MTDAEADSRAERRSNFIVHGPQVFAGLSIVGSLLVVLTIFRTRKTVRKLTTHNRLMLGISIADLILSSALVLGPAPAPASSGYPGAGGNDATCSAQGFLMQIGIGTICYSQMLLLHYVLIIRYNVREQTLTKYIEPFLHLIPIGYGLATAFTALSRDLYQSAGGFCWIGPTPRGCWFNPTMECDNPDFSFFVNAVPNMCYVLLMSIYMCMIGWTVIQKYRQSLRFRFDSTVREGQQSFLKDEKTRQVLVQCFLYSIWFFCVGFFSMLGGLLTVTNMNYDYLGKHFFIVAMMTIFVPSQGVFNLCIYIRPRYLAIRKGSLRGEGRWFAVREAMWHPVETRKKRESRASFSRQSFSEKSKEIDLESSTKNTYIKSSSGTIGLSGDFGEVSSNARLPENEDASQEEQDDGEVFSLPGLEKRNAEPVNDDKVMRRMEPRLYSSQSNLSPKSRNQSDLGKKWKYPTR